jgi:hypothetical protein
MSTNTSPAAAAHVEAAAIDQIAAILDALPAGSRPRVLDLLAARRKHRDDIELLARNLSSLAESLLARTGALVVSELASAGDPRGDLAAIAAGLDDARTCWELLEAQVGSAVPAAQTR